MYIPLTQEVAEILLMRFYCHQRNNRYTAPNYVRVIADTAEVPYVQYTKTLVQLMPRIQKLTEITADQIELMEPHAVKINRLFAFYKPILEPGISMNELRMFSRLGITIAPLDKL